MKGFLEQEGVNIMQWIAQLSDLNKIENLWEIVDRKVNRKSAHQNPNKLYQAIKETWSAIPISILEHLISSMPKIWPEVLKNRGYATKYCSERQK